MKKELIMYLGERCHVFSNKIYHLFKHRDGTPVHFSGGLRGYYFGEVYEMKKGQITSRFPDAIDKAALPRKWEPTEKDTLEYEAMKLAVKHSRQIRKKELQIKRPHEDIARAVKLLRPFIRSLGVTERIRFMAWVENETSKPEKRK